MNYSYSWLKPFMDRLTAAYQQQRFPHALLITGQPGMGKAVLADALVRLLLCERPLADTTPCGECTGCTLFKAGSHPDFFQVMPEDDSTVIKVDQIRRLSEKLALSRHGDGYKVALLAPAEAMNINAANSLLKTLEEPSDNTVLVLVSDSPARLPATIRSRCQRVRIQAPDRDAALHWLSGQEQAAEPEVYLGLASGAPLKALELMQADVLGLRQDYFRALAGIRAGREDPLAIAAKWAGEESLQGMHWLREWLMDLLRIRLTGDAGGVHSVDLQDSLRALARELDSRLMFGLLDRLNRMLRPGNSSLNRQLMVEDILLAWAGTDKQEGY